MPEIQDFLVKGVNKFPFGFICFGPDFLHLRPQQGGSKAQDSYHPRVPYYCARKDEEQFIMTTGWRPVSWNIENTKKLNYIT